jgi:hypothetical protein
MQWAVLVEYFLAVGKKLDRAEYYGGTEFHDPAIRKGFKDDLTADTIEVPDRDANYYFFTSCHRALRIFVFLYCKCK